MNKILIVPDVHGKIFWKIAKEYVNYVDKIVFLGDYLDPYEKMDREAVISNFMDILTFKISQPNDFIILMGNHDHHYLPQYKEWWGCRRDDVNFDKISKIFTSNSKYFQLSYKVDNYLFTHAGVLDGWLKVINGEKKIRCTVPLTYDKHITIDNLNELIGSPLLDMISEERGGRDVYGSPIWADVYEHLYDWGERIPNIYQVFGHTKSYPSIHEAYIDSNFAMLDSGNWWLLEDGEFKRID